MIKANEVAYNMGEEWKGEGVWDTITEHKSLEPKQSL